MAIIIVLMSVPLTICKGYYSGGNEQSEFSFNMISTTQTHGSVHETRADAMDGTIKTSLESEVQLNLFLFICAIFCGVICLISIFSYKHLKRQKRLVMWNMFVMIVLYASVYLTYYQAIKNTEGIHANWSPIAIGLMLLMLIFNFLAYRKIVKDIELLASVDRLR